VDVRDAFEATRLAIERDLSGAHVVYVTAADQSMNQPTRDLVAEFWPHAHVGEDLSEYGSAMSLQRAHDLLGFTPSHSWRDEIDTTEVTTDDGH
jgi:nucleoside-diphosphate-sugar epimerase